MRHSKRVPYIRRSNGKEVGDTAQTSISLAMYDELKGKGRYYVCVMHGQPDLALAVSSSKSELKDRLNWKRFKKFLKGSMVR